MMVEFAHFAFGLGVLLNINLCGCFRSKVRCLWFCCRWFAPVAHYRPHEYVLHIENGGNVLFRAIMNISW